jgi:probable selenium-dependent hydroxylase accessory protein YqeC
MKVLVSPTTKMFPIKTNEVMLCDTLEKCIGHEPKVGIQCFGLLNKTNGKLEALPLKLLAEIVPQYDLVLLEADGSKGLPCKGWLTNEPVIPPYCTHAVGVVTMKALNTAATKDTVHRLPEFLNLTGLKEGQTISVQALEAMVCASSGMFKYGERGRYLIVNQVEDEETANLALIFLQGIKNKFPERFKRLLYGSVHLDTWHAV